ncbi:MAG: DUF2510 domain-containing protein [Actinomycetota bacterium]|nr:DUF2510 domain-containing protein [Actinomycetota bacterium]
MSANPAGWYQDPFGRAQVRWWTGSSWTDHVATNGQEATDPPGVTAAVVAPNASAPAGTAPAMQYGPQPAAGPPFTGAPSTGAQPSAGKRPMSAMQKMAIAAVASLLVGGVVGYVVRGDGDGGGGGGGGGASAGALSTPILQGLASLNSYEWTVSAVTVGPTTSDRSEVSGNGASDSAADMRYQKMVNTSTSADDPEPSTSTTESWRNADMSCTFDGEEYTSDAANPFEADLGTVLSGVFDIVIPQGNAQLVGTEQVAGVDAQHYTFTIQGLGAGGAQVDANQGDVWVAVDGGYLLRYEVNASMRSDAAGSEVYQITLSLQLTSVNQPVSIQMPSGCPAPGAVSGGDTSG